MQPHIFRMVHREKGKGEAIIGQKVKILALLCSVLLLKSFIRCQVYCLIGHATHSVFLPGKSHRQRSLVGYSPGGRRESDTTGAELDEEHPAECQLESPQLRGGFRAPITASSDERGGEGGPGWVVTQL